MKPYTYLFVNLACIGIPFIASFYPKHAFYKDWKPFFKANILLFTSTKAKKTRNNKKIYVINFFK